MTNAAASQVANTDAPAVLFVGGYPPNLIDGGGIILRNLLAPIPADRRTIVCGDFMLRWLSGRERDPGLLKARYLPVRSWVSERAATRVALGPVNSLLIPRLTRLIATAARSADVILAVPWGNSLGSELFVAAYRAHKLSGKPLVIFELDEWRASLGPSSGLAAPLLERAYHERIVAAAHTVVLVSDPMSEHFKTRFGVEAHVFPNAVSPDPRARERNGRRAHTDEFRLVFTGSIAPPQAAAIRDVLKVIEARTTERTTLVVYTNQSRRLLARLGVAGNALRLETPVPLSQVPDVLRTADALLLPYSFARSQRAIVSTSFPTKTADYLASGVPILVHAPEYSSVTRSARDGGWAEIVSERDPDRLRAAIDKLAFDEEHRQRLAGRALERAREYHEITARQEEFSEMLKAAAAHQPHR